MSKPGGDPCMGPSKSSTLRVHSFFISVSLFDLESRFFAPTRMCCDAGARRGCQGRPALCLASRSIVSRPRLDRPEHGGTLVAIGMTIRGEPAFGRGPTAPQPCIRRVAVTRTMMQPCASAAKLRGGGPTLPLGMTAMSHLGTPPPRTVIGDRHKQTGWAAVGCFQ